MTYTLVRANFSFAPWASARAGQVPAIPNRKEEVTVVSTYVDCLSALHFFEVCVKIEQVLVLGLKFDTWHKAPIEPGQIESELAVRIIGVEQAGDRIRRLGVDEGVEEDLAREHPLVHVRLR